MAAPSGTVWGSIAGGYGRIGIYVNVTNTNTTTTVEVETWFWSKYSVQDSNNSYYYNNLSSAGSATTLIGSISIDTNVATGDGWSTSNQQKLGSSTYTYTRGTSASTRYLYAKLLNVDRVGATMTVSTTVTIPKLASYTVSYNANGGSGAPSSQSKWYGKTLTLSTTKPTRTGYSFQGWATSASGSVAYAAGASYTANAAVTLYAVWKANTYTVKYNANGGSGAPSNQTKTYGTTLTLSTTVPTRPNYNFLGWATSASATTAAYAAGGSYTKNSAVTLYAVWELAYVKPRITNLSVARSDSAGAASDLGTYAVVSFDWACDQTVSSITIEWSSETYGSGSKTVTASGASGSVSEIIGDNGLSTEATYTVQVVVTDTNGYTYVFATLTGAKFVIDFMAGGLGVAFGKPAEISGLADFAYQVRFLNGIMPILLDPETDLDDVKIPNTYIGENLSDYNYVNCPVDSGTFTLEVDAGGDNGQVVQRFRQCNKTNQFVYQRTFYTNAWGEWQLVSGSTPWNNLTIASGFAVYGDTTQPKYRVNGNLVTVTGAVTPTATVTSNTTGVQFASGIPAAFRPDVNQQFVCQGSGINRWLLSVCTDGTLDVSRYGTDAYTDMEAGCWLSFCVTYPI